LPAEAVQLKDEILAYCTEQFGPVCKPALIEIVPTEPSIQIRVIPSTSAAYTCGLVCSCNTGLQPSGHV
jgi:hypothetical protein